MKLFLKKLLIACLNFIWFGLGYAFIGQTKKALAFAIIGSTAIILIFYYAPPYFMPFYLLLGALYLMLGYSMIEPFFAKNITFNFRSAIPIIAVVVLFFYIAKFWITYPYGYIIATYDEDDIKTGEVIMISYRPVDTNYIVLQNRENKNLIIRDKNKDYPENIYEIYGYTLYPIYSESIAKIGEPYGKFEHIR